MIRYIMFAALLALVFAVPSMAGVVDRYRGTMRFVHVQPAFPKAKNRVVTLNYMPGGQVGEHMRWAKIWIDQKYRIVIADDQYSAAAVMVVAMKNAGSRICAKKGAQLYWHLLSNGIHPGALLSRADMKRIGPLTHRFKRIAPEKFGIPRC